jgi:hypothetical protein
MCEIMDELIEKYVKEIKLESIRNIMVSFSLDAEKAMDGLKIPKEEQPIYLELLGLSPVADN